MKTLALVIPCHDEFHRLDRTAFLRALERWPWLSLCFVDDGSADATAEALAHLARLSPAIHALYLPTNRGKAEAVRIGVNHLCAHTHADLVGFWDADLATPLDELPRFIRAFDEHPGLLAACGSRWPHLGSTIARSTFRGLAGSAVKAVVRRILRAPVYDTQCGAKIFTRALAREIFAAPFGTHWLFDVELLRRIGPDRLRTAVRELPLDIWHDVPGSNLSWRDAGSVFGELVRLARGDAILSAGDPP